MNFKTILKYVLLPILLTILVVFLVLHRPIIRHWNVSSAFSNLLKYRGLVKGIDYMEKITNMGREAEPFLLEKAEPNNDDITRYYALCLLGRIRSPKAEKLILAGLKDEDAQIRLGAVRGIRYIMKPEYVAEVKVLDTDPNKEIRWDVAYDISQIQCPESIAALTAITQKERDQTVLLQAWLGLRRMVPVDGEVIGKYRLNRNLQIVPEEEKDDEVRFTYYFFQIWSADGTVHNINVPRERWEQTHRGDSVHKSAGSDKYDVTPRGSPQPGRTVAAVVQAWQAMPVKGLVIEKSGINKNRQLVIVNEKNVLPTAGITDFFISVKGANGDTQTFSVPREVWNRVNKNGFLQKAAGSKDFQLTPPQAVHR